MTTRDTTPADAARTASVTDPGAIADRPGVDVEETTYEHDGADHCEAGTAGRAVVGATNDAGEVLALCHEADPYVLLPSGIVESGEDFAAVAREAVAEKAGVEVTIDGPEVLRRVRHLADGDPLPTTHHVVFAASVTGDADELEGPGEEWSARWVSSIPEGIANESHDSVRDVERFL